MSSAEAQDLQVSLDNSETKQVTVGEQLKLVCKVNRGLMFVIENYVEIVHQPLDGPEVILAVSGKLTNGDPNFYNLEIAQKEDSFTLEFLVKTGICYSILISIVIIICAPCDANMKILCPSLFFFFLNLVLLLNSQKDLHYHGPLRSSLLVVLVSCYHRRKICFVSAVLIVDVRAIDLVPHC